MTQIKGADPRLTPTRHRFGITTALCAGAVTSALFGSRVLLQTIDSAPEMAGYAQLHAMANFWNAAMVRGRFAAPDRALHKAVGVAEGWHPGGGTP
jgi:hypothetical protein